VPPNRLPWTQTGINECTAIFEEQSVDTIN
jgi:hypothetical protein